jgi:hypothetical protein
LVADRQSGRRQIVPVHVVDERCQREQRDDPRADAPSPPNRAAFTLPQDSACTRPLVKREPHGRVGVVGFPWRANENGSDAGRLVLPTGHLQRCFGQPFALHLDLRCLGGDLAKIGCS